MKRIHIVAALSLTKISRRYLSLSAQDDKHKGGFLGTPGGKVEAGETIEQAMTRELDGRNWYQRPNEPRLNFGAFIMAR